MTPCINGLVIVGENTVKYQHIELEIEMCEIAEGSVLCYDAVVIGI